jgi:hypothetical protein
MSLPTFSSKGAGLAGTALLVLLLSSAGAPAALAASIFFTPAGIQLDSDPILDIYMKPGQKISFNVYVDGSGLFTGASTTNLNLITYYVSVDTSELTFVSTSHPSDTTFGGFDTHASSGLGTASGVVQDRGGVGISTSAPGITLAPVLLDTFTYQATSALVNDGNFDFKISLGSATTNAIVSRLFSPSTQEVEVQPNPEPGTVMLMGLGAAMIGIGRWRRSQRSRAGRFSSKVPA